MNKVIDFSKSIELDIACVQLKQAIVKANICGYTSHTVKETYDRKVKKNWILYAKKHTIR